MSTARNVNVGAAGGRYSGESSAVKKLDRNYVLGVLLLFVAMLLFGFNYMHSSSCFNAHTHDEIEEMGANLKHRILTAESQMMKSSMFLEKVLHSLQGRLVEIEDAELAKLALHSEEEAQKTQLLLAKQPSPLKHTYQLDAKYRDAEVLADRVTELLKLVDDEKKRGDHSARDIFGFGGNDDDDFFWKSKQDDKWKSSNKGGGGGDDWGGGGNGNGGSAISVEKASKLCNEWHTKYSVVPNASWGDLPEDLQGKWIKMQCDKYLAAQSSSY
jgi:hypothetical protein